MVHCTNRQNSQKTVKTAEMSIGVPIVTSTQSPPNTQSGRLVHWLLMSALLHLVQRVGLGRAAASPSPLIAVPNVTEPSRQRSVYQLHIIRCGTFGQ